MENFSLDLTSLTKFLRALNNCHSPVSNIGASIETKVRKMKKQAALLLFLCFFSAVHAQAQNTLQFDGNTSMVLQEFQAVIVEEDGEVKVRLRLGGNANANPNADRLEAGDLIIMMDGQRIKTIDELKKQYAAAEDDKEMRIGVRRGDERFILRATKGDIPEGGGSVTHSSFSTGTPTGGTSTGTSMVIGGPGGSLPEGSALIQELGMMVFTEDNQVKVAQVIDLIAPDQIKEASLKRGDVIKEINGESVTEAAKAVASFTEIETGEEFTMKLEKDGSPITITMKKPASRGVVRRRGN